MNFLLDTHIWIWTHLEPQRVSPKVNRVLADIGNQLWLSPVSIWELVILVEKKRIRLNADMNTWVERSKQELALREAPFSWAVAQEMRFVALGHGDPADRFLAATARVYDLTLVTADESLMRVDGVRVMENR